MAFRANIFKKIKRLILQRVGSYRASRAQSPYSKQIGKLLKKQGNEIVTMMSL